MKSFGWLVAIIVLAAALRLYHLGALPVILNRDEAALAYNAYLLKETGADEWGRSWPLSLESFGDYKLPGYSLILVQLFKVLGETEFAVRLPAAVAGIWLVFMAYSIGKKMSWSSTDATLAALFFAVTPVFIFYSRMAWEATVSLSLFVTAGRLLLFPSIDRRWRLAGDLVGLLLMTAAVFTYNIPFILIPFLAPLVLVIRGWRRPDSWTLPVLGLVGLFIATALVFIPLTSQKSSITIFSDPTIYSEWITYREQLSSWEQEIIGSKYLYFGKLIFERVLASFSPNFLVIQGGTHPWHQVPGTSHLTWIVYGLGIVGVARMLWQVVTSSVSRQMTAEFTVSVAWLYMLAVSLIPAVITVDAPHATRSLVFLSLWMFTAVIGWQWVRELLRSSKVSAPQILIIGLLLLGVEIARYVQIYFVQYQENQAALKPGLAETLAEVRLSYPDEKVAFVDPDGYHYILVAWYLRVSPERYFSTVVRQQPDRIGFRYGERLDQYHFIANPEDQSADETVLIEWQSDRWQITER